LHDNHRHNNLQPPTKGYDLGMLGVLIHVVGDAANNVGVIISALVIWLTSSPSRYYADPAVSMAIALVILTTSLPLGLSSINLAPAWILNGVLLSEELG
jgi:zinc transporter 1